MIPWLLLTVTGLVSAAPGREHHQHQQQHLPRETRVLYARTIATSILSRTPPGARLIGARGDLPPLVDRLIHNATSIRRNIVDTFSCNGRVYGYYADQDNDCQIFHICVPMQQLFPDLYGPEDLYHFSFICPGYTIFSQDSMTCDWEDSAFPCPLAPQLYDRNNHFFVVPAEDVQRTSPTPSPSPAPRSPSSPSLTPSTSPSPSLTPSPTYTPTTSPQTSRRANPKPVFTPVRRTAKPTARTTSTTITSPVFFRRSPRPLAVRRNSTPSTTPSTSSSTSSSPTTSSSPKPPRRSPTPMSLSRTLTNTSEKDISPNRISSRRSSRPIPLSHTLNSSPSDNSSPSLGRNHRLSSKSEEVSSDFRRPPSYRLRSGAPRRRRPTPSSVFEPAT